MSLKDEKCLESFNLEHLKLHEIKIVKVLQLKM